MTVPTGPTSGETDPRSIPVTRASTAAEFGSASVRNPTAPVAATGVQPVAPSTATGVQPAAPRTQTVEEPPSVVEPSAPRLDLIETADELLLFAELPGYDEDDIVLEAIDQQIRIFAERDGDDDIEDGRAHLRERLARVERTVVLPTPVDIERADATFDDGVCRIEIPKIEESRAHRIGFH